MESNGEALKIHMSHNTKQVLDRFGTFEMTMRGFVSVKGKGEMLCFWLDGEKPITTVNNVDSKINQENRALLPNEALILEEKPTVTKAIAIVPPLTPQNSFSSKKSVSICANTNGNTDLIEDNDHLYGAKKSSIFGKKKQLNLSNEKLQPLLSTIK